LVIEALDPDPDPNWYPASNTESGSGSNEYGSETLVLRFTSIIYFHSGWPFFEVVVFDFNLLFLCVGSRHGKKRRREGREKRPSK
jgi:hypothetical protein